jgi:hypothetical protein
MPITGKVGCLGKGMCADRDFAEMMDFLKVSGQLRPRTASGLTNIREHIIAMESSIFVNEFVPKTWYSSILKLLSQNKKEQQMNAEMVKACANDKRQAWCALPSEVREAMRGKPIQVLDVDGTFKDYTWALLTGRTGNPPQSVVVRLSTAVKADPEYEILNASKDLHNGQMFWGCVMPGPRPSPLSPAPSFFFPMHEVASMANFSGIRYELDEGTWWYSIRCDMGAPVQVRFLKS